MGRIGRAFFRLAEGVEDLEVVAFNDVADPGMIVSLLRRDSTFGRFERELSVDGHLLLVDGRKVAVSQQREPADLPWRENGVDVVVDASGKFRTRDALAGHLEAGASRV